MKDNLMKGRVVFLWLLFGVSSCRWHPEALAENGGADAPVRVREKPSGDEIWKSYWLQCRDLRGDIPGVYKDPPYVLEYGNRFIVSCPIKRGALAFMVARRGNRLEFVPVTEKMDGGLFEEACRRMRCRPVRFVNGTALRLENGQLVSDYTIECFPEGASEEVSEVVYLEWRGIFDVDFEGRTLVLKTIEGPLR